VDRTTSISLSKAMKVKNRLTGRLQDVQINIATYNSVLEGRAGQVDVLELDKRRTELAEALASLKTAIAEGSRPIQRAIYDMAEKRSEITFLKTLNTKHGTEPAYGLHSQPQVYVAAIKKADVDARIKKLEADVDILQDRVDAFNSGGERIEVETRILELAG
jgi:hypothetical protein